MAVNQAKQTQRTRTRSFIGLTGGVSTDGFAESVPILDSDNMELLPDGSAMQNRRGSVVIGLYDPEIPVGSDSDDPNRIAMAVDTAPQMLPTGSWLVVGCDKSNSNAIVFAEQYKPVFGIDETFACTFAFADDSFMWVGRMTADVGVMPAPRVFVTRTGAVDRAVSVDYASSDGTATVAAGDYTALSGTLTFAKGEVTKEINPVINADAISGTTKYFNIALSDPSRGCVIGGANPLTIYVSSAFHVTGVKDDGDGEFSVEWRPPTGDQGVGFILPQSFGTELDTPGVWSWRRMNQDAVCVMRTMQQAPGVGQKPTVLVQGASYRLSSMSGHDTEIIPYHGVWDLTFPSESVHSDTTDLGSDAVAFDLLPYTSDVSYALFRDRIARFNPNGGAALTKSLVRKGGQPFDWGYAGQGAVKFYGAIVDATGHIVAHRWCKQSDGTYRAMYLRINPVTGVVVNVYDDPFGLTATATATPMAPWRGGGSPTSDGNKGVLIAQGGHLWLFNETLSSKTDLGAFDAPPVAFAGQPVFSTVAAYAAGYVTYLASVGGTGQPSLYQVGSSSVSLAQTFPAIDFGNIGNASLCWGSLDMCEFHYTNGIDAYVGYQLSRGSSTAVQYEDCSVPTANGTDTMLQQLISMNGVA